MRVLLIIVLSFFSQVVSSQTGELDQEYTEVKTYDCQEWRSIDEFYLDMSSMQPPDTIDFRDPLWRHQVWSLGFGFGKTENSIYNLLDGLNV